MKNTIDFGLLFNRIMGLLFLVLGVWVVFDPEIFTQIYGISAPTSEARSTLRAVIGGTELALAAVFLLPRIFGLSQHSLHNLGLAIFACIVSVRIGHIVFDAPVSARMLREVAIEFAIALAFLMLARPAK